LITVADALFPLWHPKRQALHDLAAKTQVTRPRMQLDTSQVRHGF